MSERSKLLLALLGILVTLLVVWLLYTAQFGTMVFRLTV